MTNREEEMARRIVETLNPSPGHFMFGKIIPATEVDTVARAYLKAREALEEISLGRGPFKIDPMAHAESVIEAMKEVARAALKGDDT